MPATAHALALHITRASRRIRRGLRRAYSEVVEGLEAQGRSFRPEDNIVVARRVFQVCCHRRLNQLLDGLDVLQLRRDEEDYLRVILLERFSLLS